MVAESVLGGSLNRELELFRFSESNTDSKMAPKMPTMHSHTDTI